MGVPNPPANWVNTWLKPFYLWIINSLLPAVNGGFAGAIVDPGASGAIPVVGGGVVNVVTAGAETRTVADPTSIGQQLLLNADTIVTSATITFAHAFDNTPHTHIEFTAAGQSASFIAVTVAGVKRWRLVANDGGTLS